MIRPVFLAIALLSSMPVAAQDTDAEPAEAEWDMIRFDVLSWGGPVTWWQFTPEYGGVWAQNTSDPGVYSETYTLAFHPLEADRARYDALAGLMRRLPDPAPDSEPCENFLTDQAYGTIRLTRGATTTEIAWNSGCMDEDYAAFMAILREADALVSGWGREVPVGRTEDFRR